MPLFLSDWFLMVLLGVNYGRYGDSERRTLFRYGRHGLLERCVGQRYGVLVRYIGYGRLWVSLNPQITP